MNKNNVFILKIALFLIAGASVSVHASDVCPSIPRTAVYIENKTAQAINAKIIGGFDGQDLDDYKVDLNTIDDIYCPARGTVVQVPREAKKEIFKFKRGKMEQFKRSTSLGIAGSSSYSFFKQSIDLPGLARPIMFLQRRDSLRIVKGGESLQLGIAGPDGVPMWYKADRKPNTASFKTTDGVYKITFYAQKAGLGVFAYDDVVYEIKYEGDWVRSGRKK